VAGYLGTLNAARSSARRLSQEPAADSRRCRRRGRNGKTGSADHRGQTGRGYPATASTSGYLLACRVVILKESLLAATMAVADASRTILGVNFTPLHALDGTSRPIAPVFRTPSQR